MRVGSGLLLPGAHFFLWVIIPLIGLSVWACEPETQLTTVPLVLRQLASCPLEGSPDSLEISALGDFQTRRVRVSPRETSTAFGALPEATRELGVSAASGVRTALGRRRMGVGIMDAQALWLLPLDSSCPLADDLVRVLDGTLAVALPGSALLIAGGTVPGGAPTLASAAALLLREGSEAAEPVASGMLLRRAYASATLLDDAVLVAGGAADLRGTAHDTYEIYDLASERFLAAMSGKLQGPRMQHAAWRLPDGKVLLAGGRAEAQGEPLASAELLDRESGTSKLLSEAQGPRVARIAPVLLQLDSGSVLLVAGRDAAGEVLGSIERFDVEPGHEHFLSVAEQLPPAEHLAVSALPGARLAWLACNTRSRVGCALSVISEQSEGYVSTPLALPWDEQAAAGLSELQLTTRGNGHLLLTAADDGDPNGRRRAFDIDLDVPALTRIDASRVAKALLTLESGAIAELDETGMSLRAATTEGSYASPLGNLIEPTRADLHIALSAPQHWQRTDAGLQARVDHARLDLTELRFADFALQLALTGDADVMLYDGGTALPALQLRGDSLTLAGCTSPRAADAAITVERRGDRLSVGACTVSITDQRVGIALTLMSNATLGSVTLERL